MVACCVPAAATGAGGAEVKDSSEVKDLMKKFLLSEKPAPLVEEPFKV